MAHAPPLKGMTWDHPRGYSPLLEASREWLAREGIAIEWDRRSLQDFEAYPVRMLAQEYDLVVLDHPHVGAIAEEGCLVPLDAAGAGQQLAAIAAGSVGRSFASYEWRGHQWALPVDAATQVQAWRPDRLAKAPAAWEELAAVARDGGLICPLRPPHALMSLFTLCGLAGAEPAVEGPDLFAPGPAVRAYERLRDLAGMVDPGCFAMDPIAVLDRLAQADGRAALAPLVYGYVSYSIAGFREHPLRFGDLPVLDAERGPAGSALGGTGIAVSALRSNADKAAAFAFFVAGAAFQRDGYSAAGGQAGHAAAWDDEAVNQSTDKFYRNTRLTLEGAWVRPRHPGYMRFQEQASERLDHALRHAEAGETLIADLNTLFRSTL